MSIVKLLHIKPRTLTIDPGKWDSHNTLGMLVQELEDYYSNLEREEGKKLEITSIPDIWAKPKLFEAQLRAGSPKNSVLEWRAILAIIGLRALKGINLEVKSIMVPKFNSAEYNNSTVRFLKVVSRLMDEELSDYAGKNVVNVIAYNNQPIALVWPNSVIYPISGVDIRNTWCNSGNYKDPTENGVLTEDERLVLAKWLYNLKETVIQYKRVKIAPQKDEKKNKKFDKIVERLEDYIKGLGYKNIESLDDKNINELSDNFASRFYLQNDFDIPGYGGNLLNKAYKPRTGEPPKNASHVCLDSLDGKRHALVISDAIAEQWKISKHLIRFYNYNGLDKALSIIRDNNQKNRFIKDNNLTNINTELWTEEDFFTDKIVVITGFNNMQITPLPNSLTEMDDNVKSKFFKLFKNNLQEFVLPIKQDVLKFISAKDLLENIDIQRDNLNSDITVSLTITLSGFDASRKEVTLTKVYKFDQKDASNSDVRTIIRSSLPNVQIWPNFKHANWKKYYVFTGRSTKLPITIVPVWTDGIKEDLNFNIKTREEFSVKLRSGTEFPTVFVCRTVEKKSIELGLICLDEKKLDPINSPQGGCYIGVDFGTTNTVVSYAPIGSGTNLWKQMTFKDRVFSVTRVTEAGKADLRRYFFPANSQPETIDGATTNSIRTIFHGFQLSEDNENEPRVIEDDEQALVQGNIYYLERGQNISDDKWVIHDLKSDIKWDNEKTMRAFLYQLCLQAMAEVFSNGFTKIIWQYSWPMAFDNNKKEFYKQFWKDYLIKSMNDISKMSDSNDVREKTESESMADYFQNVIPNGGYRYTNGLLTIDIGGGTTDISVWDGSGLLGQCSFRLAGSNIFSGYIANKYKKSSELLTPLGGNNGGITDNNKKKNLLTKLEKLSLLALEAMKSENQTDWQTFKLELESILKYSESDLLKNIRSASNDNEELNIVMRDIAFALGGIFYYVGSFIAHLRNKKQKDDGTIIQNDSPIYRGLPDCFVGGNGSKLLNWAAKGAFNSNQDLKGLFRMFLLKGISDNTPGWNRNSSLFQIDNRFIKQSDQPKIEVSLGLISSEGRKIDSVSKGLIFGGDMKSTEAIGDIPAKAEALGKQSSDSSGINMIGEKDYSVVSGEQCSIGEGNYAADENLNEDVFKIPNISVIINPDPGENRFLKYLNTFNGLILGYRLFAGKTIKITDENGSDEGRLVVGKISNELQRKQDQARNGESIEIEPIFIMELRQAMDMLSKL